MLFQTKNILATANATKSENNTRHFIKHLHKTRKDKHTSILGQLHVYMYIRGIPRRPLKERTNALS